MTNDNTVRFRCNRSGCTNHVDLPRDGRPQGNVLCYAHELTNELPVPTERWAIEAGNAATLTETIDYCGTQYGAVRKASKRWRQRASHETSVVLRRPGCRPLRTWKEV